MKNVLYRKSYISCNVSIITYVYDILIYIKKMFDNTTVHYENNRFIKQLCDIK